MEYFVRTAAYSGYRELVTELGQDPDCLLQEAGFDPDLLATPDHGTSYRVFLNALNLAANKTATPHFGLLLSTRQQFSMLGAVGMAMKHAPDLGAAIANLQRFFHIHMNGARIHLEIEDDMALWKYEVTLPDPPAIAQQIDLSVGIGVALLRGLLRRNDCIHSVHLMHRKPADCRPYRRLLGDTVYFDQEFNGSRFDRKLLEVPLDSYDTELLRVLYDYLAQQDSKLRSDLQTQVRDAVARSMQTGDVSIEAVAQAMIMTTRTLQRRLRAENTSFKDVLDDVRKELSQRYLRDTSLSLTQISAILCYAELATFSRFFKRFFDTSPSEWRLQASSSA